MIDALQPNGTVVVDDDTDVTAEVLRRHLVAEGYTVEVAPDGPSGLDAVRRVSPDLVLVDILITLHETGHLERAVKSTCRKAEHARGGLR